VGLRRPRIEELTQKKSGSGAASGLIAQALGQGRSALTESEGKALLAGYGIAVAEGELVHDEAEALRAARRLGFPLVLKGASSQILHKSDAGLVLLDLRDEAAVRQAYRELVARGDGLLDGVLVERMLSSSREFVCGLIRDSQFGPVVMFGLGGVLAEALNDVAFGVAPLSRGEAESLLDAIRSRELLGPYRGAQPVDRRALVDVLMALGRIAEEHPEIREMDINPLLVPEGRPVAADALITLGPAVEPAPRFEIDFKRLDAVFNPRSVAVVGASSTATKWGGTIMTNILAGGFEGPVYPINPGADRIFELPAYPSIAALPEVPDLAVVAVPARAVRAVVEECAERGVRAVVVVTSGFSEVSEEGAEEEERIAEIARRHGMPLVGPNCMGIISSWSRFYATGAVVMRPGRGPAACISQSGNMGIQLMSSAEERRGGIGRFIGVGNEAMVDSTDFLEYLHRDPRTGVILLYMEGADDGRRFLEIARETARDKPVVVLKGGSSDFGSRAAASHTGAMAGSAEIFEAAARQAGINLTYDPDEFLDLAFAFSYLPIPKGRRTAIVTMGGGWGVVAADEAARSGLDLARLPEGVIAELDEVLPPFWSRANPVDLVGTTAEGVAEKAVEAVVRSPEVDGVVVLGVVGMMTTPVRILEEAAQLAAERGFAPPDVGPGGLARYREREERFLEEVACLMDRHGKPIINVSFTPIEQAVFDFGRRYATLVLPSPLRGVRVMSHLAAYGCRGGYRENCLPKNRESPVR